MWSDRIKDLQPISLESNKADVVSFTKLYNFLKNVHLKIREK